MAQCLVKQHNRLKGTQAFIRFRSLMVRTPRCGRGNPGSNPGEGRQFLISLEGLPRFELGLLDSESKVIANYTTGPLLYTFFLSCLHSVGFEPTPPERTELESVALDHSAKSAFLFLFLFLLSNRQHWDLNPGGHSPCDF